MRGRWSRPSRRYLAASIALAAMAVVLLRARDASAAHSAADAGPLVTVMVAARTVQRGALLSAADVRSQELPERFAPPGWLHSIQQAAGRVLLADLAPGEVVTGTRLARVRAGPVASLIPPGYRAFAVPVPLPSGTVAPGDRVDVLATFGGDGTSPATTQVIAASLQVLALGNGATTPSGLSALDASAAGAIPTGTVFVLVRPEQETALAQAASLGNLEVVIAPPE